MNRFSLISLAAAVATVVLATAPAHAALGAGEGTPGYPHEVAVSASVNQRADVRAEAVRAVAEGRVASGEIGLATFVIAATPSNLTLAADRAQVRAEAAEAVRLGLVASGEAAVVYTAPQLAAIQAAGERATQVVMAARR